MSQIKEGAILFAAIVSFDASRVALKPWPWAAFLIKLKNVCGRVERNKSPRDMMLLRE